MRWKTHRALAVFSYSALMVFSPYLKVDALAAAGVISAYWGATLPDQIETEKAHRTYGHSLASAIIFSGIAYLVGWFVLPLEGFAYGFICGVWSHLLTDALTDNGICALWPFYEGRIDPGSLRLWYYSQGKLLEEVITMVAWFISVIIWVKLFVINFIR